MQEGEIRWRALVSQSFGPTATIQNSEPLVTGNKARIKYGLPLLTTPMAHPFASMPSVRNYWLLR